MKNCENIICIEIGYKTFYECFMMGEKRTFPIYQNHIQTKRKKSPVPARLHDWNILVYVIRSAVLLKPTDVMKDIMSLSARIDRKF